VDGRLLLVPHQPHSHRPRKRRPPGRPRPRDAGGPERGSRCRALRRRIGDGLNLRTTTHELAHQLAFNSGLQRRDATYPFWLTEGLATNFEADASGAFGLDPRTLSPLPPGRRQGRPQIDPAEQLHRHDGTVLCRGQSTQDAYAQAWGLFHFLLANHRDGLRRYMADLTGVQFARVDSQSLQRRFIDDFGPIEPLEKDFLRFIDAQNR